MTDITNEHRKLAETVKKNLENFVSWWNAADAAGLIVNFHIAQNPVGQGPFRTLASYSVQTKPLDVLVGSVAQEAPAQAE